MRKKGIMLLFLFVLSLTFIQAQPPFQQSEQTIGISLESPVIEYHKVNEEYAFHVHAHNSSDGLLLRNDTTNCIMHVYRPSDGEHVFEGDMEFCPDNNVDFELELGAGNFTEVGQYAVVFYCEVPGEIGGFFEYGFDTTKTGLPLNQSEALIYLILSFGILLLSIITFYFMLITPYQNELNEKGNLIMRVTRTKYIKLGLILITYALFTWFLNIMIGLAENFASLTMYYGLFGGIFWIMNALSLPVSVVIIVIMLFEIVRDANIQDKIKALGSATR